VVNAEPKREVNIGGMVASIDDYLRQPDNPDDDRYAGGLLLHAS